MWKGGREGRVKGGRWGRREGGEGGGRREGGGEGREGIKEAGNGGRDYLPEGGRERGRHVPDLITSSLGDPNPQIHNTNISLSTAGVSCFLSAPGPGRK